MNKLMVAPAAVLAAVFLTACGSNGGNNNPPTVTVSPATANVQQGSTQQFIGTVTNTTDTALNWSVNGVAGGNSTVGTVDGSGLYTAPLVVPNPASVTITAALQASPTISAHAIATISSVTFTNSSLRGNYVFTLNGIDLSGFAFYAVGAVTADGNGNITQGEEDLNDVVSGYSAMIAVTGTYSVGADGRGILNLNSSLGSFSYAFALRGLTNAGLNEIDNQVINATGDLEQQAVSITAPSGNYSFGFSGRALCGSTSSAGIFSLANGSVSGLQDLNCGGTITQAQGLGGSYTGIDAFGRGTGSFPSSTGSPNFVYYVVSPSRYRFISPDLATFFLGSADLQTQTVFANTDFTGPYVISFSDNTTNGVSYTLIQINPSNGSVSTGYYDVNDTGTVGQANLTGAYNLASNGRINGTFNVNGSMFPFSVYLISPTQGYYLDQRRVAVGGGNIYAQAADVSSNSAWAGSYATKQFGYFISSVGINPGNSTSVSGQISANGNGMLAGTLDFNDPTGVFQNQTLQGTYNVTNVAPGRTIVSITTPAEGARNYVAYIINAGRVVLMENDFNVAAGGDAVRQF